MVLFILDVLSLLVPEVSQRLVRSIASPNVTSLLTHRQRRITKLNWARSIMLKSFFLASPQPIQSIRPPVAESQFMEAYGASWIVRARLC
jgi:hypothetical protein